jgi:uncharacterized protein (TIGR00251 family)
MMPRKPDDEVEVEVRGGEVLFLVRVQPRASRDAIEGEHAGALKVRLTAPPVDDRANEALVRLLAERLNVPRSAVRIVSGEKSRTKRVAVAGLTREQVVALFAPLQESRQKPGKKTKD